MIVFLLIFSISGSISSSISGSINSGSCCDGDHTDGDGDHGISRDSPVSLNSIQFCRPPAWSSLLPRRPGSHATLTNGLCGSLALLFSLEALIKNAAPVLHDGFSLFFLP